MKLVKKLFITLLLLSIAVIALGYFLLQSSTGAHWLSQWLSEKTTYTVNINKISHTLSQPLRLTLTEVTLHSPQQTPLLTAKKVTLAFSLTHQWKSPLQLTKLYVDSGVIKLTEPGSFTLPNLQQLRLHNIDLEIITADKKHFSATGLNLGITSWEPTITHLLGENSRFQLSANTLSINELMLKNMLLHGQSQQGLYSFSEFGADLARGQLTGKAHQQQDGSWDIETLQLSHIRWQTPLTLQELQQQITQLPGTTIRRLDLLDVKLEGKNWAVSDLDVTLLNTRLQQGRWSADEGSLTLSATDVVTDSTTLTDPLLKLDLTPNGITIKQFTTRWEGGLLRTHGYWQQHNRALQLDDLSISSLEYTLPQQWRKFWQAPLPNWLNSIKIDKFSSSRNLLIDTNPQFPLQITQLDGYGKNLILAKEHQLGIWQGELNLSASNATFNKVDLQRPSIKLFANGQGVNLSSFSTLIEDGLLEAKGAMTLTGVRPFNLSLTGRAVPPNILSQWGWHASLPAHKNNFSLHLQGSAAAEHPIKQSLQGTLLFPATDHPTQTMVNGIVQGQTQSPSSPISPPARQIIAPPAGSQFIVPPLQAPEDENPQQATPSPSPPADNSGDTSSAAEESI